MTADGNGAHALPPQPNFEHLKNDAKDRLAVMRENAPDTKLADAQFALARDYGFSSWRALKDEVERRTGVSDIDKAAPLSAYAGFYDYEPGVVENAFVTVTCEADQLFIQAALRPKLALTRQSDGWFTQPGTSVRYGFSDIQDGHAETLHQVNDARRLRLARIDAATADNENAARARAAAMQQARPRNPVEIAPQILERYAGHYLAPSGPAIEIIYEAGRLFEQMAGQSRMEIFPESESEFFLRATPAQMTFHLEKERSSALTMSAKGLITYFYPATAEAVAQATAATAQRSAEQRRPRTVVPIDAETLTNFVGRYLITEDRVLTITAEDGHLFGQITDQSRHQLYPESSRDFFFTAIPAQVSFIFDAEGRASHAVLRVGGQEITLLRMDNVAIVEK
jgi:Domain of unknown function (DUF3471)